MPVEHLWQWLREEVTYHFCYDKPDKLIAQVETFTNAINAHRHQVADRLWVSISVNPQHELLRFSKQSRFKYEP